MIRAVVDTSVLVSAFIGRPDAAPSRLLGAWRDGHIVFIVSRQLLDELEGVLARPKFARWSAGGRGVTFAAAIGAGSEFHVDPEPLPATRDPADDDQVALANVARADVIVSVDRDLLDADLANLRAVTPSTVLERIPG